MTHAPVTWIVDGGRPSFSSDGSEIVYESGQDLRIVPVTEPGRPRLLVKGTPAAVPSRADWSWSPTTIAFGLQTARRDGGYESTIWLVESDGKDARQLPGMGDLTKSTYPSWYRGLDWIVVVDAGDREYHALWRLSVDDPGAAPVRLTPDDICAGRPSASPRDSADASVAFAGLRGPFDQQNNQIWIVSPPSQVVTQLDAKQGRSPNWSPDGNWILFESDRSGAYQLFVAPAHGVTDPIYGTPVPITAPEDNATHGEWSRQQDKIAFNGTKGIGVIDVPDRFRMG